VSLPVAETFEAGGRILVEAGTGTGKTLAYLVPAILGRQRVLVSTGTKNLQEQIYFKDLPALAEALGVRFTATYMKGRGNYLCLQRLEAMLGGSVTSDAHRSPDGRRSAEPMLAMIAEWARGTETGDRAELAEMPEDLALWNDLAATSETCVGSNCPHHDDCFVTRMRQRAAASDIVIVNHHLLCADAAVRQGEYGEVIPACAYAVVDEAHQLEDVATQYFGVAISNYRVEQLCRDAEQLGATSPRDRLPEVAMLRGQAIERLRDRARAFFMGLQFGRMAAGHIGGPGGDFTRGGRRPPLDAVDAEEAGSAARQPRWGALVEGRTGEDRLRLTSEFLADSADAGYELGGALDEVEQAFYEVTVAGKGDEAPGDTNARPAARSDDALAVARRAGEIRDDLRFLLRAGDPDFVYYLETRGRGVFLRASPIDVSGIVRSQVLDRFQAVVLTSATLSVAGSFDYVRGRLGAHPAVELSLPSEFDYSQQAILYLPARMPDPRSPAFAEAAATEVIEILERTRGRAFVLFTSYAMLRAIQPVVEAALAFPILVQGTAPRSLLLQQFRTTSNAVLLATSSFWQGVDVVGEALSCVIVDKLPFASPADPVTSARIDAITRRGGEPFWEYQVPLAILTLQQGLGRLIRHRRDRGVLAVLDPRLRTKAYGRTFLAALPPAPVTSNLDAISRFFAL
jgi:ATP-dependent DNA helicase DinG